MFKRIYLLPVFLIFILISGYFLFRPYFHIKITNDLISANCECIGDWKLCADDGFCGRFFEDIKGFTKPYMEPKKGKMPKNMVYLYNGPDQNIIDLLHNYKREGFVISITNSKGRMFSSRIYESDPVITTSTPKTTIQYNEVNKQTDLANCGKDFNGYRCIMDVSVNTKNEQGCTLINDVSAKNECYGAVGVAKLDQSLCGKIDDCQSCKLLCFTAVAIRKNDATICENLTNLQIADSCYEEFAVEKQDNSVCNKIIDRYSLKGCLERIK